MAAPRYRAHRWCDDDAVRSFASEFFALLDVPVWVGDTLVSQQVPPWKLTPDEQFAWCQENFGFDPMGVIPLGSSSTDVTGAAFVLPYTAQPGSAPATGSTPRACSSPTRTISSFPGGRSSVAR